MLMPYAWDARCERYDRRKCLSADRCLVKRNNICFIVAVLLRSAIEIIVVRPDRGKLDFDSRISGYFLLRFFWER